MLTAVSAFFSGTALAAEAEPASLDLAERHDFRFLGADPHDELGVQVAFGDLDGDGYDEVILGAWLADGVRNKRARCGEVYVFFGKPIDDRAPGSLDASVLYGPAEGSHIGSSAATGDFDGDGIVDLLIGARYAEGPPDTLRERCGEAFLLLGGSSGEKKNIIDLRYAPGATIIGREEGHRLGRRITVADLDQDGKDDLLLSAPGSRSRHGERHEAGALFVFYGGSRNEIAGIHDLSFSDVPVLHGSDEADGLGNAMAVGDWNGDDAPDLFLGCGFADGPANSRTNAGETFVLFGRHGVRFEGEREIAEGTECTIYGAEAYDAAGVALAAGDFDGDGFDDIAIGANLADGPKNERDNCGEAYILFGGRTHRSGSMIDLAVEADLTVYGEREGDQVGTALCLLDWNGDGFDDLITVSLLQDGPGGRRPDAGMIYAMLGGRQSSLRSRFDLQEQDEDLRMIGPTEEDRVATLLTEAVIDGRRRLIAATMLGDGPKDERGDAGEVYILRWKPEGD